MRCHPLVVPSSGPGVARLGACGPVRGATDTQTTLMSTNLCDRIGAKSALADATMLLPDPNPGCAGIFPGLPAAGQSHVVNHGDAV